MVKAADRAGVMMLTGQDSRVHWDKARALGRPLEAVLCLSPVPALSLCSVSKLFQPEYGVAGALNGAALEVVQAETVDVLIPATAEIATEGRFRTDVLEMEGPFGEYGGYVGAQDYQFVFEVSAITHRRSPILQAFISEMPPSESSCIRKFGFEGAVFQALAPKVPNLVGVNFFEGIGASSQFLAISLKKGAPEGEAALALQAASSLVKQGLKWIIAVDEDIDITDIDSVLLAMAWRVQPHRDIEIHRGRLTDLDPSAAPVEASYSDRTFPDGLGGSGIPHRRHHEMAVPTSQPAEPRVHGERTGDLGGARVPGLNTAHPLVRLRAGLLAGQLGQGHQADEPRSLFRIREDFRKLRTKPSYYETGIVVPPDGETS